MAENRATVTDSTLQVDDLLIRMTLEEKASLTIGRDFWTTVPIDRLGIPSIWLADGPTGLRKSRDSGEPGIGTSIPATCFPTESALAASWNVDLMEEIGRAIGEEAQAEDVQVLLAPGVNLKRSPLGGRNFEYFSEDPILSGTLAAGYINGVQSQGVGTSLKHFAANEQETGRMYVDSVVDARTLRELYLRPFEIAVRAAQPWTLMAAYNRLNGIYCTENRFLLHDILKEEWGYAGIVMSDWVAINDRIAGIEAGCHLQMPGAPVADRVVEAVRRGELAESRLDEIVRELLSFILKAHDAHKPGTGYDREAHHLLARRAAGESITLLKNEGDLLPIEGEKRAQIAVIGAFARAPRYQGGGSSEVVPTQVDNARDALFALAGEDAHIDYAQGYGEGDETDLDLLEEARTAARSATVAVLFVGLPPAYEMEGVDRTTLALPASHNELVEAVLEVQPNVAVVLTNGSAVAMPWADQVPAIVEGWLAGQGGGSAIAEVLLGHANPSGKLPETFPVRLEETPPYPTFPAKGDEAHYSEGLFTGYRWYDTREIEPLFPFGHGLSYTTFQYRDLSISPGTLRGEETIEVSLKVKNTGTRPGGEIVQLYIHERQPRLPRPERELRDFRKVALEAGQEGETRFQLSRSDFAYYDPDLGAWVTDSGEYDILIGASSRDIRLQATVTLDVGPIPPRFTRLTLLRAWLANPAFRERLQPAIQALGQQMGLDVDEADSGNFIGDFLLDMPVAKLVTMGIVSEKELERWIEAAAST